MAENFSLVGLPANKKRVLSPAARERKRINDAKPENVARRRAYRRSPNESEGKLRRKIERAGRPLPKDGRCEKCQKVRKLRFDHDHETGRFRGWICNGCNTGLGNMGDNIAGLEEAIAYIKGELPWQNPVS